MQKTFITTVAVVCLSISAYLPPLSAGESDIKRAREMIAPHTYLLAHGIKLPEVYASIFVEDIQRVSGFPSAILAYTDPLQVTPNNQVFDQVSDIELLHVLETGEYYTSRLSVRRDYQKCFGLMPDCIGYQAAKFSGKDYLSIACIDTQKPQTKSAGRIDILCYQTAYPGLLSSHLPSSLLISLTIDYIGTAEYALWARATAQVDDFSVVPQQGLATQYHAPANLMVVRLFPQNLPAFYSIAPETDLSVSKPSIQILKPHAAPSVSEEYVWNPGHSYSSSRYINCALYGSLTLHRKKRKTELEFKYRARGDGAIVCLPNSCGTYKNLFLPFPEKRSEAFMFPAGHQEALLSIVGQKITPEVVQSLAKKVGGSLAWRFIENYKILLPLLALRKNNQDILDPAWIAE
jgi:hypothetical protein